MLKTVHKFKSKKQALEFIKKFKTDNDNWIYFSIDKVGGKFKWLN